MISTSSMPDLLAPEVIATAGPLILETFLKHYLGRKDDKDPHHTARVDLMYDEAFTIMKTFLGISSHHTVNALQKFGMTRTPAPPWVAVHRLHVPHRSMSQAADYLVTAFGGEEMAYKIAGGVRWWQVRTGPGVEAEWICMKKAYRQYLHEEKTWAKKHKREQAEDVGFLPEMDKTRCMLYIHGGAYYWGSINTHRYIIWRFARKIHGRCFAVNYRKAPQYPFPCALQDCLAAYVYLVNPPPGSPHHPVDPKHIIIAGDSAGGGLVMALLQILRDTPGLELPAGAVLISPWLDQTHSFPSLMQNTKTDVIPPYGFLHKPSSLWPPPPPSLTEEMQSRIMDKAKEAANKLRLQGKHGKRDKQDKPGASSVQSTSQPISRRDSRGSIHTSDPDSAIRLKDLLLKKHEMGEQAADAPPTPVVNPSAPFATLKSSRATAVDRAASTLAQCTDPIRIDILGERVAIDNQIQLYATNAQLRHPWVSPVNGYLGGLCPLYILAGDKEVLRDEIIYAAHKAARPDKYPVAEDVRQLLPSLVGIEQRHQPTNVHLQVYDGVGHDLPLFSMTRPARGTFRAIASFCRYVTPLPQESTQESMDSESLTPPLSHEYGGRDSGIATPVGSTAPVLEVPLFTSSPLITPLLSRNATETNLNSGKPEASLHNGKPETKLENGNTGANLDNAVHASEAPAVQELDQRLTEIKMEDKPSSSSNLAPHHPEHKRHSSGLSSWIHRHHKLSNELPPRAEPTTNNVSASGESGSSARRYQHIHHHESRAAPGTAGNMEIYAAANPFTDHMIRERVDIDGRLRPLEAEDQLGALTMPAREVGMVKERPALRFVEGQAVWDRKFKHVRARIARHRTKNLERSKEVDSARIVARWQAAAADHRRRSSEEKRRESGDKEKRWGSGDKKKGSSEKKGSARSSTEETRGNITADSDSSEYHTPRESLSSDRHSDHELPSDSDPEVEFDGTGSGIGPTWSWQWALDDEAPPPSAIISRRDLPEGRNLALMADTLDDTSHVSTLSLWMLFVAMFTPQGHVKERNRKKAALKEAKALHKERKMGKAEESARNTGDGFVGAGGSEPSADTAAAATEAKRKSSMKSFSRRISTLFHKSSTPPPSAQ